MVLPFPYRLITAWINNPSPDPLDGPMLEVVEAPWTFQSKPDMGTELSKVWVQVGASLPLHMAIEAWQFSGYSPRLLDCGSNDRLDGYVVNWFVNRAAHEEWLENFEFSLECFKHNLEQGGGMPPMVLERYLDSRLIGLQDLNTGSEGIRDQEIWGMYLILSKAARGFELLPGAEERISIFKQLSHLFEGLEVVEIAEAITGVRLVDRLDTLVREYERVISKARGSTPPSGSVDFNTWW